MDIEIIFDTVCPWCYIGKRRLEQAMALRPNARANLSWRPFLLNPEMPQGGLDRSAYLVKKFGSESRVRRIYGAIGEAGHSVEIPFAFDRIEKTPNSVDSHRLVKFASQRGETARIVEALFIAFFIEGKDIGSRDVLIELGSELGLETAPLTAYFSGDEDVGYVYEENARAHRLGINGVPSFVFNGKMVISGAQEPQVLARLLDAADAA